MENVKTNAEEYINKIYDAANDTQKQALAEAFKGTTEALNGEQQNVQQQTGDYLQRTEVEAQKARDQYNPPVTDMANQQAALTMENQQKRNEQALRGQQQTAEGEIERLRKLYADQYSAAIKKAQAENDMAKAQQLYEAAKAKESELKAFSSQIGTLDNQALIDKIYASSMESATQDLEMQRAEKLSELAAAQEAKRRQTDAELTQTYVDALKQGKNYAEVQNASGLGSGNMAQAQLAQNMGMTEAMTELRRIQAAADAGYGIGAVEAEKAYADSVADMTGKTERAKAEALYKEALTQKPKKKATSGGTGGGPGTKDGAFGYDDVRGVVSSAQTQGATVQEIQEIINAAYRDGEISNEQRTNLSYIYANSANKQNQNKGTSGGAGLLTVRTKDEFR
jgi:hypothetical protein